MTAGSCKLMTTKKQEAAVKSMSKHDGNRSSMTGLLKPHSRHKVAIAGDDKC